MPVSNKLKAIPWDESELISRLKQGNEEAFRILMQEYQARLYSVAFGICLDKEESLDIVQDVFFKVYQSIHTFRGESGLYSWLRRITINRCLNWRRSWKRRFGWSHQPYEETELDNGYELESHNNPEDVYERKELGDMFQDRLKMLPEDARIVFVLKEVEGLSYNEISSVLKIKRGTVSSRLFYARQRLKSSLQEYIDEDEGQ